VPDLEAPHAAIAFLCSVGLSVELAGAAALAGELLRRLSLVAQPRGTEYAVVLDAATGIAAGPEVRGSIVGEVEFASLRAQMKPGRGYLVIHTHWLGSFSLDDARLFVSTREVAVLLAVGRDGRWYSFTESARVARAPIGVVDRRYLDVVNRLRRELALRILRGALTEDEALAEIEHLVWREIAAQVGIRYDRSG
jgi:hypothetical protein